MPAVGGLAILSGSSMGPSLLPNDDRYVHVPGSSVTDSTGEQLTYIGNKLIDFGSEVGSAIGNGVLSSVDNITDGIVDCGHEISDGVSHLVGKIIDTLT